MIRVGIVGASGYTGVELLRLLGQHPHCRVVWATGDSAAGTRAAALYPSLAAVYPDLVLEDFDESRVGEVDVVFLGLPHEASLELVPRILGRGAVIVDLSAAFRLSDADLYPKWYGFVHDRPDLLSRAVYGLPELNRASLVGADLVATPGCYVTAASLALTPLVRSGVVADTGIIVDAASGVTGAGRVPKPASHFATVNEDFSAYGLLDHRHTPEIEMVTGARVLFTPHLAPMNRGILATCYARPAASAPTTASLLATLATAYEGEPFVVVHPRSPSTKATLGSNSVHLTARFDERTGFIVVIAALDNLTKGASGGAVQAMNVALGIEETAGLTAIGVYP